jgi:hypothetical protein
MREMITPAELTSQVRPRYAQIESLLEKTAFSRVGNRKQCHPPAGLEILVSIVPASPSSELSTTHNFSDSV